MLLVILVSYPIMIRRLRFMVTFPGAALGFTIPKNTLCPLTYVQLFLGLIFLANFSIFPGLARRPKWTCNWDGFAEELLSS